jgi:hypothetical protein
VPLLQSQEQELATLFTFLAWGAPNVLNIAALPVFSAERGEAQANVGWNERLGT